MQAEREICWVIETLMPDQLPLARLAAYMTEVATLLGDDEAIRFDRIEAGSTHIVARVATEPAWQRTRRRLQEIQSGMAPQGARNARTRLEQMVAEDGVPAELCAGGAQILRFGDGQELTTRQALSMVEEAGTLTGRLYGIAEGPDGTALKVRIRLHGAGNAVVCTADPALDDVLRANWRRDVRVTGYGKWRHDSAGSWTCTSFRIIGIESVDSRPLREAIDALRKVRADWPADPLRDVETLNSEDDAA